MRLLELRPRENAPERHVRSDLEPRSRPAPDLRVRNSKVLPFPGSWRDHFGMSAAPKAMSSNLPPGPLCTGWMEGRGREFLAAVLKMYSITAGLHTCFHRMV